MKTKEIRITLSMTLLLIAGYTTAIAQDNWDVVMERRSQETIEKFIEKNWSTASVLADSYAYAVFPSVGKGGLGIGGAHGKGILYENGIPTGDVRLTQVSVGFQWGGQSYSEIILFEDKKAVELFKTNRLEIAAQASVVVVTAGVSVDVPYENGVAIYTMPKGGLMYEAAVGGQKLKYLN